MLCSPPLPSGEVIKNSIQQYGTPHVLRFPVVSRVAAMLIESGLGVEYQQNGLLHMMSFLEFGPKMTSDNKNHNQFGQT